MGLVFCQLGNLSSLRSHNHHVFPTLCVPSSLSQKCCRCSVQCCPRRLLSYVLVLSLIMGSRIPNLIFSPSSQFVWYNKSRKVGRVCPACRRLYQLGDALSNPFTDLDMQEPPEKKESSPHLAAEQEISGLCASCFPPGYLPHVSSHTQHSTNSPSSNRFSPLLHPRFVQLSQHYPVHLGSHGRRPRR